MCEILKVIRERRSTRAFKPSQVPFETLEQIIEAATWAPSGNGAQAWHFTVLHNAEKVLGLARAVAKADNRGADYNFYGAPTHILVSCPRDNSNAYLDGGAAIQNIMLTAHALGVGSCWINQIRVTCNVPEVRALLREYGVPDEHDVVGSVAVGYIAKETPAKPRHEGLVTIVE
ncbi:MAG: nitroreductase family protein [Intestinibacillus sp.]